MAGGGCAPVCCFSSFIRDAAVLGLILGLQADFPLFTTAADRPVNGHHTQLFNVMFLPLWAHSLELTEFHTAG